jgi:NTE family protein
LDGLPCDLVLSGGDVKAPALVGAVAALTGRGYRVNRVAGTSSGSIVAALVAAGVPPEEMEDLVVGIDFARVADYWPVAARLPWRLGWIPTLIRHGALCRGEYLARWLAETLGRHGVHRFDDLAPPEPSPENPAPTGRDRLVVVAADVTSGRLRRLPGQLRVYRPPADLSVADAVRASAAVPFLFPPVRIAAEDGVHLLVDGGVASTVPVSTFDSPADRAPRWPTFGITLTSPTDPGASVYRTDGLLRFATAILSTMRAFHDRLSLDRPDIRERTIAVPVDDVARLAFSMSRSQKLALVRRGRETTEAFLDGWDDVGHLARRAAEAAAVAQVQSHRAATTSR